MSAARAWLSAGQFLLVVGACWWLFDTATGEDVVTLGGAEWGYVVAGLLINAAAQILMGVRLHNVANAAGMQSALRPLLVLNFQSVFYLFVLPLGIGMEAARYVGFRDLFRQATRRDIVVSLLTDRALGLATSLVFAALAWGYFSAALTLVATVGAAGLACIAIARLTTWRALPMMSAFATSLVLHGLVCAAVWMLCVGFGLAIDPATLVLAISMGVLGAIVPVALAGVQAGDFAAAGLLVWLDVDAVTALTVATLYYFSRLQGALIGALVELNRSSKGLFAILRSRS